MNTEPQTTPAARKSGLAGYLEDAATAVAVDSPEDAWERKQVASANPTPLRMKHIVWGVFLGMWAWSVSAGLLYALLK